MDRFFTIMIVPEKERGILSFRVPRLIFNSFIFIFVVTTIVLGILIFDYWKVLRQVYENKHLIVENRHLKEQIQLFQMKINTLSTDIERIQTFEKKLRVITGLGETPKGHPLQSDPAVEKDFDTDAPIPTTEVTPPKNLEHSFSSEKMKDRSEYRDLKNLYEKKLAAQFGMQSGYSYTKEFGQLMRQSFSLAAQFALFDTQYIVLKDSIHQTESKIHELDQHLLDKESFLRSTPTLLPANGVITSYYGPRISPYSNRLKMHEGIDVAAISGTRILAPADGVVIFSGSKPGFGKLVQIDHGYGVETVFAHSQTLMTTKGSIVRRGDPIAQVGNTGYSTGPHLHYEVRVNGINVDPLYYILD